MKGAPGRQLATGLAFLAPNILGFLAFTLLPLGVSLVLAFSNWDLKLHNQFHAESIRLVGWENFRRLLHEPDFWKFLGNTLFLMMGIPFATAGSLGLALLLSRDLSGGSRRVWAMLLGLAGLLGSATLLALLGAGATSMTVLLAAMAGGILILGLGAGPTVYRTLLYLPSFTAGVAVFILWKKLFNSNTGPINQALTPLLDAVSHVVRALPAGLVSCGLWVCVGAGLLLLGLGLRRLRCSWADGEMGTRAMVLGTGFLLLPPALALGLGWLPAGGAVVALVAAAILAAQLLRLAKGRTFRCHAGQGLGNAVVVGAALAMAQLALLGLGLVLYHLPARAAGGLAPPEWLTDYYWAKPALMLMAFWASIGSNNMLLYLAGLSNVPLELYEAADIDGASRFQKFWYVTWPQLAPTTFFIVVMSMIGGLQGGFEMARTMTQGGPAGSTTTLSYFIYAEGFETGRLGYSSAAAWMLFVLVLLVTSFNWKFGSRYAND